MWLTLRSECKNLSLPIDDDDKLDINTGKDAEDVGGRERSMEEEANMCRGVKTSS